jgi:hypothetical protein
MILNCIPRRAAVAPGPNSILAGPSGVETQPHAQPLEARD